MAIALGVSCIVGTWLGGKLADVFGKRDKRHMMKAFAGYCTVRHGSALFQPSSSGVRACGWPRSSKAASQQKYQA